MEKFILIYEIKDFAELGGGLYFEKYKDLISLTVRVNNIIKNDRNKIIYTGVIDKEIKFIPKQIITELVPEE